eukprot:gene10076-11807_t
MKALDCDLPVVKYLCEVMHLEVWNDAVRCAIQAEKVSFLEYFKQCGYKYRNDSVEVAISGGHLQSLEYLSEDFHLRDCSFMWVCAAKSGQIPSMEFLLKIDCGPDESNTFPHLSDTAALLSGAFQGRHLDMYLYEAGGIVADARSFEQIAGQVPTECIRWVLEHGSAVSLRLSAVLAGKGNVDALKMYVVEQGVQLSSDVMLAAVGSLGGVHRAEEKVRFLLSHHCPCDARATEAVAFWACTLTGLHRNCWEYMIEHGCPGAEKMQVW